MKVRLGILAALLLVIPMSAVTIDWVGVGDIDNDPDPTTGYGSVAHEYKIGRYEVTTESWS